MTFLEEIDVFLTENIGFSLRPLHVTDVVEIAIIALFIYAVLIWIKNTRAWMLFRGLLLIVFFFAIAAAFQMTTILWLGAKMLNASIIALVVVFQPELRHALDQLGRRNFIFALLAGFNKSNTKRFGEKTLTDLVRACYEMGAVKTGALIVVEQDVQLSEYEMTGIEIGAVLSRQLLINIFEKNTPLHDGAVIVRGDKVVAATCYLPLSDSTNISKDLGTRHRAAVGISEVSDALTIVVSEETGKVSVTRDGKIIRDLSQEGLADILKHIQKPDADGVLSRATKKGRSGADEG
jgi:diadenylate cyclase